VHTEQLLSKYGNPVKNQVVIHEGNTRTFKSYNLNIAKITQGHVTLDEQFWDYSVTTGFYRNQFLGENKAETQRKIDSGEYLLGDLN